MGDSASVKAGGVRVSDLDLRVITSEPDGYGLGTANPALDLRDARAEIGRLTAALATERERGRREGFAERLETAVDIIHDVAQQYRLLGRQDASCGVAAAADHVRARALTPEPTHD